LLRRHHPSFGSARQTVNRAAIKTSVRHKKASGKVIAIRITASFGISTVLAGEADISLALLRADKALYQAKSEGRNRVVRSSK
jgi:PleD family two-component response regulator